MDIDNTVKLEMMNEKCRTSTGSMCLPVEMCVVCGDRASGRHYGAISCEGCKGFFKRSIRKQLGYQCRGTKNCEVTKHHRNRCQYCRLQKCLSCGMRSDSVQHERKPIIDKRDYSNNTTATTLAFTPNPLSKIFIRKDLGLEQTASLASTFNLADLGASSHETNYNISPSHASFEDDASMDSDTQGDNNDAISLARNRSIISKAWDTMARVQYLTNNNANDRDSTFELEGPVLLEQHIPFTLQTPGPVPPYLNAHYICESGSRLLFLTVHWVRNIPAFHMFGNDIQIAMLRGCWSELFILGLSQCAQILSLASILSSFINHLHSSIAQEKISTSKVKQVTDHICRIQDYVKAMEQLHLDEHEYAYLKAIVLFSTDLTDLLPRCQLERFQEKSFQGLRSYVHNSFPGDADRFPKLLLRLPPLRAFEAHIIEELFFSGLIGHVQINNVIPYILRMGNGGRAVKVEQNNTEDDYGFKKH